MPKATINEVIKEAIAKDQPTEQTVTAESPVIAAIAPEIIGKLTQSRDRVRMAAKEYVLGGVPQALEEILAGDYGDILPLIDKAVDTFAVKFADPKLPNSVTSSQSPSLALPEAHNG